MVYTRTLLSCYMTRPLTTCSKATCICHYECNAGNTNLCDSIKARSLVKSIMQTWMQCCNTMVKAVSACHVHLHGGLIFESIFSPRLALDCSQEQFEEWVETHWQHEKTMYTKIHNCIKYIQITPWAPDIKTFYDHIVGKLVLFHNTPDQSMEHVIHSRVVKYNKRWDMTKSSS